MSTQSARRRLDVKLRDQRRDLRRERLREEQLNSKHAEMQRHNEMMRRQKQMEREHAEKNKDLDLQMDALQQSMETQRDGMRKGIAIKSISKSRNAAMSEHLEEVITNVQPVRTVQSDAFRKKMEAINTEMDDMNQRFKVLRNL